MITNIRRQSHFSWLLVAGIIVGLISALYLVYERHSIERDQRSIENIVDYDAVIRASSFEKRPFSEAIEALKKAHITAAAIYDRTLNKAVEAGEALVVTSENNPTLTVNGRSIAPGETWVLPVSGKEGYYEEIKEDLIRRLGQDKVTDLNGALVLNQPHEALMAMNLGISRLQAQEVESLGFHVIVRPTNYKGITADDVKHVFHRIDGIQHVTGMVFVGKEALGYPNQLVLTNTALKDRNIPVVGIEAMNQLQYEPQAGFMELAAMDDDSVGRLYSVSKDELKKLTPTELSQWFYISDLERNIRFNLFPIYDQGQNNDTALETSIKYINNTTSRLADRGFTFTAPSIYPVYAPAKSLGSLVILGAVALFVMTLSRFVYITVRGQLALWIIIVIISIGAYWATSGILVSQLWALSSAIAAPVCTMTLIMDCWLRREKAISTWRASIEAIVYVVVGAALSAIGGMYIASLLGSTPFFMEFQLFRGVKLVFVAPVVLTAIAYLERFPLWKSRPIHSFGEAKDFVKGFLSLDVKVYTLVAAAILAMIGWVFVGRSGHTAGVPVPSFEIALRRFLENTMYARPREKEFIIGHPALMLATVGLFKHWPMGLHFILTLAGVIGISSLVETFCHLRTPVLMSIARGYDGVLLGIAIGIVAIIVCRFLQYGITWAKRR